MRSSISRLQPLRAGQRGVRIFAPTDYGTTVAYRRLSSIALQSDRWGLDSASRSSPRLPSASPYPQKPQSLLSTEDIFSRQPSALRSLHTQSRLYEETKTKGKTEASESTGDSTERGPAGEPSGEGASAKEGAKEDAKEGEAGSEDAGEKNQKKEAPPPPPPHGDKTPWQVFTETLKTEFKASKDWNEGTKQLGGAIHDFTSNPNVQKARSTYRNAADAASSTAGSALKSTGKVLGQSAAWTWETPVVRGVRKGVNAAGSGVEKITRPIRETEAFKSVKDVIDDGSSSRYGGWVEKEERRKKRELKEQEEIAKGGRPSQPIEEDPLAGTNITVHKDAQWKESWRDFRDTSRLMQSIFAMKSTYNESENPLISTARSITDRIAGFFAENETAMVIKKFREMDPNFQIEPFLQDMREFILPEVLEAYVKGDVETLKLWLSAAQYQVYEALMKQYTTAGLKSDGRILDIRHVDILNARLLEPGEVPVFIITCRTQEVHVYRNRKTNELAAGMEDKVQLVTYAIGVTRLPEDVNNPQTRGWRFIELQKSAREYI